jgi:hypothetical protein
MTYTDTHADVREMIALIGNIDGALEALGDLTAGEDDPTLRRHYGSLLNDLERLQEGLADLEEYLDR